MKKQTIKGMVVVVVVLMLTMSIGISSFALGLPEGYPPTVSDELQQKIENNINSSDLVGYIYGELMDYGWSLSFSKDITENISYHNYTFLDGSEIKLAFFKSKLQGYYASSTNNKFNSTLKTYTLSIASEIEQKIEDNKNNNDIIGYVYEELLNYSWSLSLNPDINSNIRIYTHTFLDGSSITIKYFKNCIYILNTEDLFLYVPLKEVEQTIEECNMSEYTKYVIDDE